MRTLDWHERLSGDRQVMAVSDAERHGETWVYADCRSVRACESLFDSLCGQGWRTLARRAPAGL